MHSILKLKILEDAVVERYGKDGFTPSQLHAICDALADHDDIRGLDASRFRGQIDLYGYNRVPQLAEARPALFQRAPSFDEVIAALPDLVSEEVDAVRGMDAEARLAFARDRGMKLQKITDAKPDVPEVQLPSTTAPVNENPKVTPKPPAQMTDDEVLDQLSRNFGENAHAWVVSKRKNFIEAYRRAHTTGSERQPVSSRDDAQLNAALIAKIKNFDKLPPERRIALYRERLAAEVAAGKGSKS